MNNIIDQIFAIILIVGYIYRTVFKDRIKRSILFIEIFKLANIYSFKVFHKICRDHIFNGLQHRRKTYIIGKWINHVHFMIVKSVIVFFDSRRRLFYIFSQSLLCFFACSLNLISVIACL